ncbi:MULTISPECIES: 2-hydroxyacid dehydrogenase [Streptomyces]|uniref:2-hydroxyacid dehydrogenase n=1 Tax=Streptomyces doudnae TaxID=3075536 RepID=A0ABD5EWA4_9ACTN|nr:MULTISPECIES: 2-hydroxyacid dehydrogenase [unclassified Streptomyces]MDT0439021.1 2-hydroxyacid dehydrogenase [Streptomyces sp. DSM 41981]MYQ63137.1 hydroxyacid dehydrogenase [Streptomyces sp. SID4950]SCD51519.1 D-3-phosphoglycerate dehydrogenase [Streptomyces sp. SolWspMP-5a-2]
MNAPLRVVAAGDHFVLPGLITRALTAELGEPPPDVRELTLGWPMEPFGRVAEVREASDAEGPLIDALSDGREVLVTQMAPVTERVLGASPGLRLVVVCRGGPVNVNLDAAERHDVRVCYAPGRNAAATAEFTVGLLLAALRRIPQAHDSLAGQRGWRGAAYYTHAQAGLELEDLPVGLIGYGAVGSRVARALAAFGAQVMVHDPYARGEIHGLRMPTLDDLLRRSRVVTLHARLTPETRGLIGARELGLLPRGAVLVNAARGPLVDEEALCDALADGTLSAAALDTFEREPLPARSRLFGLTDRVVLTPHLGGASRAVAEKAARIAAAEVGRWARGEPLAHSLSRPPSRRP